MDELTPIFKGALAVTPVGSGLVTWYNERKSQKEQIDLNEFRSWVVDEINKLHSKKNGELDNNFLESDEFEKLLFRIIGMYLSSLEETKKNAFKRVLVNSVKNTRPTELLRGQYLHILELTSSTEIEILSCIYSLQNHGRGKANSIRKSLPETNVVSIQSIANSLSISPEEVLNIAWSLSGRGLLFPLSNDLSKNTNTVLTPFGANFCLFIMSD